MEEMRNEGGIVIWKDARWRRWVYARTCDEIACVCGCQTPNQDDDEGLERQKDGECYSGERKRGNGSAELLSWRYCLNFGCAHVLTHDHVVSGSPTLVSFLRSFPFLSR